VCTIKVTNLKDYNEFNSVSISVASGIVMYFIAKCVCMERDVDWVQVKSQYQYDILVITESEAKPRTSVNN